MIKPTTAAVLMAIALFSFEKDWGGFACMAVGLAEWIMRDE